MPTPEEVGQNRGRFVQIQKMLFIVGNLEAIGIIVVRD
jgi:hypothetical protein